VAKKRPKKPTRKKTAKKLPKRKKTPTAIEKTDSSYHIRGHELRAMAARDYIFDPEQCSIAELYNRADRPYVDRVSLGAFRAWSYTDGWAPRREEFWQEHELRVHEAQRDQLLRQRLEEIRTRTQERDALSEWLQPKRDPATGDILRYPEMTVETRYELDDDGEVVDTYEVEVPHPHAGLPMLNLEPGNLSQFVNAFVKFDQHLMTMRGEATSRTEHITRSAADPARMSDLVDPVAAQVTITADDIHEMSRVLLRQRQPELSIDAEWEEVEEVEDLGEEDDDDA
jgi:hypothetical protein